MATIRVPRVVWHLGDREQSTVSGVTTVVRPLYYTGKDGRHVRVGTVDPDYAEQLMKKLLRK